MELADLGARVNRKNWLIGTAIVLSVATAVAAQHAAPAKPAREYSPNLAAEYPDRVYFGDTHLHTSYSVDAGMVGDRLGPDEAYRFARGETVTASLGHKAKLRRPLDFLVVADHAESMGLGPLVASRDPLALADPIGRQLIDLVAKGDFAGAYRLQSKERNAGRPVMHRDEIRRPIWDRIVSAADRYNDPGKFTAFIGYEYTSAPNRNNLHRVVMFRDGGDKTGQVLPLSAVESSDPEQLWAYLENYEKTTGGRALAIPHNGNLSNGRMFDDVTFTGAPLSADYARRRQRWEPLYEVTQIKGDGETHPLLSTRDEFADYYRWDRGNFGTELKTPAMLPREYARQALQRGLAYEAKLGVNPFKFGMIGSSDSHTSLAGTAEDNFFGKVSPMEPGGGDVRYDEAIIVPLEKMDGTRQFGYESLASGLVGVWARANTREEIFDAMMRREVFATTGTRLRLRMFASWNFTAADKDAPDLARVAYAKGVPMGSDLTGGGATPTFLVEAMRDPDGANLDRIQIVKGWIDSAGKMQERVFDVAWSGNRKVGKGGKLPPVGNSVKGATYTNTIGAPVLSAYWRDPTHRAGERAFYYARVLEIPTPTWLAYDMVQIGQRSLPKDAKLIHQERGYGSPIWVGSR
ncbi:DUF3604 domain-containing protein [Sphingorhabdus sp.]|uniref:DUF3604 domain-containing protein n=1 Tax=Sphingorhabdus sp. TaxID=1902408 RepID=UPI003BB1A848